MKETVKKICPVCRGEGTPMIHGKTASIPLNKQCTKCAGSGRVEVEVQSLVGYSITLTITSPIGTFDDFVALLHKAMNKSELHMDFEKSYAYIDKISRFPHFEVEILEIMKLVQSMDIKNDENITNHLSTYLYGTEHKTLFMNYTGRIADQQAAIEQWESWCLGFVWMVVEYKIHNKKVSFQELFVKECDQNIILFAKKMKQQGIEIVESSYEQ